MSKLLDYSASLWIYGPLGFMVLSIVVGIVQKFRGKHDLDLPAFLLAPIAWLWLIRSACRHRHRDIWHADSAGCSLVGALIGEKLLERDEARRIAANIAKLPELLKG